MKMLLLAGKRMGIIICVLVMALIASNSLEAAADFPVPEGWRSPTGQVLAQLRETDTMRNVHRIALSDGYIIRSHETEEGDLRIGLFKLGSNIPLKSFTVKNAEMRSEDMEKAHFDSEGGEYYFLTACDQNSTYGAQTNIVVWKSGVAWDMIIAPFQRGFIEDRNSDGVHEIVESYPEEKVYRFSDGEFIEVVQE
jgi:hypothetical protein